MGCRIDDPGASRRSASEAWPPDFGEREDSHRVDGVPPHAKQSQPVKDAEQLLLRLAAVSTGP